MTNFKLLPAKDYITDLTRVVEQAKKEIYLMAIIITDDDATHQLIQAVTAAAKRGVKVRIAADAYTYSELGGYYSPLKRFHSDSRDTTAMARSLKQAGADFVWLGDRYKLNVFGGNTHIKWSVVDSTVYCFGGVNLYKKGIASVDYMFKSDSPQLAKQIIGQHGEIVSRDAQRQSYGGFTSEFPVGTVYIDSGQRGDSLIYRRACELAEQAKRITYVSQYCPTGQLALLIKKTAAHLYFNQPKGQRLSTKLLLRSSMLRSNLGSLYKRSDYLHAKFILFEMKDGQKIALTGSHNFSYAGVRFGTREVALETSDKSIYQQLESFYRKNIK